MWRVEWRNGEQASGAMTDPGLRQERKRGHSPEANRGIMPLVGLECGGKGSKDGSEVWTNYMQSMIAGRTFMVSDYPVHFNLGSIQ
jgi:hypothetical protein